MLKALVARVAAARVDNQQVGHEVFRAKGNRVPIWRVELVVGGADHADERRVRVAEEGRKAAQH